MRIFTKIRLQWNGQQYVTDMAESEWFEYSGPVEECKGASAAENAAQANSANLFQALQQDLTTTFGQQQGILNNLNQGWSPIFQAGPSQYGFTPAEDSNLRTQADTGVANNYQQAKQATGEAISSVGGGNVFLPSGSTTQIEANNANAAAGQRSAENLGITQAGYATGRQNFLSAANALSGVASQENPLGYAGTANSANSNAFNEASQINKENQAASPWGALGGILGGVAGSFLGPIGTSLGSSLGSAIGGSAAGDEGSAAGASDSLGSGLSFEF